MNNKIILSSLACAALFANAQKKSRPNVIVLLTDDVGYGDLSCYGARRVHTPNIDALARQGVLFTDAHCAASTSTPSRYGILTGEYPFRKRDTDIAAGNAGMIIKPNQFTLADLFKKAGYATGAFGKWHLGLGSKTAGQDWNGRLDECLKDLGFDYSYIMAATADRVPCVFIENDHVADYDPSAPIFVSYKHNFPGEPTAKDHPELLTKLRSSHGHNQSIVNGIGRIGYMKGGGKALWKDEHIADSITAHANRFIEQHKNQPFFMYLCTNDIHVPRYPADRFRGKSPMGLRGDAILQLDWTVGAVCKKLKELGLYDNTMIIFTSDNGPVLDDGYKDKAIELVGNHRPGGPFRGGKYSAFEAGSTIPFIVSWPAVIKKGQRSPALISQIDAMASLAKLIGESLPENAGSDSKNELKTWLGKSHKSRPYTVAMASNRDLVLRTKRWKYIAPSKGSKMVPWAPQIETGYSLQPQLYDMNKSLDELDNEAKQYPKRVKKMKQLLKEVVEHKK